MPKTRRKSEENRLFQKTRIQTILDKSPWDSTAIFIFFCYFSVPSLNSSAFSKFSCSSPSPHPIQSWNSEKNYGYTRPTLFVGWGEGLDLCELENAPEKQKCPKTFVHDCRQAKMLMTIGQHIKTFSSPKLMIAFQITGKRSDLQHHG